MRIGFVGAGRMGRPMIERLAKAGHTVRAVGRSAETRAALAETGAEPVASVSAAAAGAEALVVCVFTDDQVREVCLGGSLLSDLPRGAVLIVHTTGSPATVAAIAEAAEHYGVEVVDAPVSGGPHNIAAGKLTVFLGGSEDAVARAREVVCAYADPAVHVGALGSGQRVKLVNNALFAAQIGLVADAVRLGEQLGLDEATLLSALPHASSSGRALLSVASKGAVTQFMASVGEFLGKDVAVARALVAELGGDLGILEAAIDAGVPAHDPA
ncbi:MULTISPECIES: NAD(P)-dependent oxidoreductase [Nocardia]|uniref:NAD(P)-binding domain-containing protein n=1 Tax=Nocardia aurea TaxID=2144174 RepID=A0ABV3G2M6_9NOCA|nr:MULTISPECIES: NAD(P)-binding domain-containing protein [Nocardia]